MDWDDFKFVHALAEAGTVRQAGEMLGVHGSTVIRRLDALERRLNVRLFSRSRDGMKPTPAGCEVLDTLEQVAAELESVTRRLRARDTSLSGRVVLAGPELLLMVVAHRLHRLHLAHPALNMRLEAAEDAGADPVSRRAADLALCLTRNPPPDLVGRRLGTFQVAVYGRPECFQRPPNGISAGGQAEHLAAERMSGCPWIGGTETSAQAFDSARARESSAEFSSGSGAVRLAALRAGQGVGPLPCLLGDLEPELVRDPSVPAVAVGDIWLLSHPDQRGVARVRAVAEFVQSLLGELSSLSAPEPDRTLS